MKKIDETISSVSGKIESSQMTHDESIELAGMMDYMRKELGLQFPEDTQEF